MSPVRGLARAFGASPKDLGEATSNGMKIVYIANLRLPTEKAYGIQIAKTCEAFAALKFKVESEKLKVADQNSKLLGEDEENLDVELDVPYRISKIKENFFDYCFFCNKFFFCYVYSF